MTSNETPSPRQDHAAVWTGSEMLVWGGRFDSLSTEPFNVYNDGARFNPALNVWTPMATNGAPAKRIEFTAVWTGSEMIIWGGALNNFATLYNDGVRYSPVSDTWTPVNPSGSPSARSKHSAVWTGNEMIVWGGNVSLNNGGRYNPASDSWAPTTLANAPAGRIFHSALWTGGEMIVWGGSDGSNFLNSGGRYNPSSDS